MDPPWDRLIQKLNDVIEIQALSHFHSAIFSMSIPLKASRWLPELQMSHVDATTSKRRRGTIFYLLCLFTTAKYIFPKAHVQISSHISLSLPTHYWWEECRLKMSWCNHSLLLYLGTDQLSLRPFWKGLSERKKGEMNSSSCCILGGFPT